MRRPYAWVNRYSGRETPAAAGVTEALPKGPL